MEIPENYLESNLNSWNERAKHHFDSDFYNVKGFLNGECPLNEIELKLLGDIKGKKVLHLQCHFGMDTLALARRGADVTGVDFSDEAIKKAGELSHASGLDGRFICSDIYSLDKVLDEEFDVVFASYGVVGWLPDMDKWATIVSRYLKPGGHFIFAEFHPVIWMFDNDFKGVAYSYFNTSAIIEDDLGSYAAKDSDFVNRNITWNHSISEVFTALISKGLKIEELKEFDYSPYDCLSNMVKIGNRKFQIKGMEGKLPVVYALKASK